MPASTSREEFLQNLLDSGLFPTADIASALDAQSDSSAMDGEAIAQHFIAAGKLTAFQAEAVRTRRFDELLIGNYQVLDRLGAGAMGTVYKARHPRMKRVVAIKVLSPVVGQSETFVPRFQREVEAVARLTHPNIVMAYDADEAEAGHFLVMEFINGRDLAKEVRQRGALPVSEAVDCIVQSARGLDYAHKQGIIHRDIKPANLIRDISGQVKVADLGLARFNDQGGQAAEEANALTQTGTIMGTVDYMPPEQALALTDIDHRADIYSLGCTLHFLLTGRPPYHGPTMMSVLLKHREAEIPSMCQARAEIPVALDRVFARMVAKNRDERFGSMAEVAVALEAIPLSPEQQPQKPGQPPASQTTAPTPVLDSAAAGVDTRTAESGNQTIDIGPATSPAAIDTVLLVEPSRSQAVIIRGFLQKLECDETLTASSGQEALRIARDSRPRAVISAMHLTDMTGVQLAQKLRAEQPLASVGFILITSQADAQESSLQIEAGNMIRLPKPFNLAQLNQALTVACSTAADAARPKQARHAGPASIADFRVLLVDDSAPARVHVRNVLAGLGVRQIVEAPDGAEAVIALEKDTYDLVVTDYTMPRLDGRGLIEFIRTRSSTPSVPVIVVTTETDPAKLDAVRQLGVSAIFDKRFQPDVVRGVLERLV